MTAAQRISDSGLKSDTQNANEGTQEGRKLLGKSLKKLGGGRSIYSVMYCPSFVKIGEMGSVVKRLHHRINWNCAVPKILNESYKLG